MVNETLNIKIKSDSTVATKDELRQTKHQAGREGLGLYIFTGQNQIIK